MGPADAPAGRKTGVKGESCPIALKFTPPTCTTEAHLVYFSQLPANFFERVMAKKLTLLHSSVQRVPTLVQIVKIKISPPLRPSRRSTLRRRSVRFRLTPKPQAVNFFSRKFLSETLLCFFK